MSFKGTYDGTIFYNPASRYCIISIKTSDRSVPEQARSSRHYQDRLIRFTAVGYELPRTDAVEMELDGEWVNGKHGCQLQVEQWHEIVPQTVDGVKGYLSSGLIKGVGEKTADEIVDRFGVNALDILENSPEKLLEIRGITENRLEDIKTSYAESRMLRDIMTLLAPFKLTPVTALKVYQHFGASSLDILKKSPFELCQIPSFGFKRVDAIVRKTNNNLHDPMRIRGAIYCALGEAKSKQGHLFLEREALLKDSMKLLNSSVTDPELRVQKDEAENSLQEMILYGTVVSAKDDIYQPAIFDQEDETARLLAQRLMEKQPMVNVSSILESVKNELGITLAEKQELAVQAAFRYNLSIITGSPGTGKTTVLKTILVAYQSLYPGRKIMLMAPTGRASRRMAESTGFEEAKTMHSGLGLFTEEAENSRTKKAELLDVDLVICDEFSMVDMWLARQFFSRIRTGTKIILVGDPDQLPSVGPGNVFREMIECGLIPVTVLDIIFRQSKDSLIAYNAKFINEGNTRLYYGNDFMFVPGENQEQVAEIIMDRYCQEIAVHGIENVQILSPFRSEGAASSDHLNANIRELVNPFRSTEDEIRIGTKSFRIGDRIMQTKNTDKVSNGDMGFIRYIKDTPEGRRIGLDFGEDRNLEYGMDDLVNLDLAYASTIHKAMGSEYDIVLMPMIKAHTIMLYRKLLYTGITRAKKGLILVGQKSVLFMAIHRNEISKRNTCLGARICLYYKAFAKNAGIPIPDYLEEKLKNAS